MKAWRQHPSAGRYVNRRGARKAGSMSRNAWFSGSKLLFALMARVGIRPALLPAGAEKLEAPRG